MGCDIHLFAETKNRETGEWELVPGPIVTCWRCTGTGVRAMNDGSSVPCYACSEPTDIWEYIDDSGEVVRSELPNRMYIGEPGKCRDSWYDERNYYVFACLANVRNHEHIFSADFTSWVTSGPIWTPVMSDERGLPDDCSKEARDYLDNDGDIHSVTWVGLEEIFAYTWPATGDEGERNEHFMQSMKLLAITTGEAPTRIVLGFDN